MYVPTSGDLALIVKALEKKIWSLTHVGMADDNPFKARYIELLGRVTAEAEELRDDREFLTLRLTGTAVDVLADNGHLPGWPRGVDPAMAVSGPDHALDTAAAEWFASTERHRVGSGFIYLGRATRNQATEIMDYLDSVAGSLLAPGVDDASARAEGRRIGRALDHAVDRMHRDGWLVTESRAGYKIARPGK